MTDSDLTHLYFLLDRSGSMHSIREATVAGFDAFIAEQRLQPGRCRVTLVQFDTEYEQAYADLPVEEVPSLDLQPRGMTALLDAMGRMITEVGQRLAALPEHERPGTVVFATMTDGLENSSREFTHAAIRAMVEQQSTAYSWQFLYLGADQDAIEVGASLGVARDHAMTYHRGNVDAALSAASANIGAYRAARRRGEAPQVAAAAAAFSEEQRDQAGR